MFRRLSAAIVACLSLFAAGAAPADAATTIAKANRECLVFIANVPQGNAAQVAFDNFVAFDAEGVAVSALAPLYNKVHVVSGAFATRAALSNMLNTITSKSSVKAVDLFLFTHGLTDGIKFSNQSVAMSTVRNDIKGKLNAKKRLKLRMVHSTASFGMAHRLQWIQAGFKTASGSKLICADTAVSFPAFLSVWTAGGSFSMANTFADLANGGAALDEEAKDVLFAAGHANWESVDSERLTSGPAFTVDVATMP